MITRTPRRASSFATVTSSLSKNCPSSIPTTSVSGSTFSRISAADRLFDESCRISECETIWLSENLESNSGLKTCTFCRAILARRRRRMSSSDLPENIEPAITSTQPTFPRDGGGASSWLTCATSSSILVVCYFSSGIIFRIVKRCESSDQRKLKTHRSRHQIAREYAPRALLASQISTTSNFVDHKTKLASTFDHFFHEFRRDCNRRRSSKRASLTVRRVSPAAQTRVPLALNRDRVKPAFQ